MKHKCLIIKLEPENKIIHIGFTAKAFDAMEKRATDYCKTSKLVSVEIKKYDPDKTPGQNDLFHVLCRKIAQATSMDEGLVKDGIKATHGAEVTNPFWRANTDAPTKVLKSVGDYTEPEMTELIFGAFAEGDYLRELSGYTKLDLRTEYEDFIATRKEE